MPCIVESPVAHDGRRLRRAARPCSPTAIAVSSRTRCMRSSTRQRPRSLARKRRLATVTARGNSSVRQRGRPRTGPMQSSGRTSPMPQRSMTRTRVRAPGFTLARGVELEAVRARRRAHAVGADGDRAVGQHRDRAEAPCRAVAGPRHRVLEDRRAARLGTARPQPLELGADAFVEHDAGALGVEEDEVDDARARRVGDEVVRVLRRVARVDRGRPPARRRARPRRRRRATRGERAPATSRCSDATGVPCSPSCAEAHVGRSEAEA